MWTFLIFTIFCGLVRAEPATNSGPPSFVSQWIMGLKTLLEDCPVKTAKVQNKGLTPSGKFVQTLADCARDRALMAIDNILEDDVIPMVNGLELVKFRLDGDGKRETLEENGTVTYSIRNLLSRVRGTEQLEDKELNWQEKLSNRLSRVLSSHVIKIDFDRLVRRRAASDMARSFEGKSQPVEPRGKGRRRRRRQLQVMPMIMMGVLLMGTVLIPMGFQFLAVLGGKALILAKLALMLSSIQGLKKIATNGVNYGLYHAPVPEVWHERSTGQHEIPYSYEIDHDSGLGHYAAGGYTSNLGTVFARRSAVQPT